MKRTFKLSNWLVKNERGAVIILVAFLLVFVLIGMAALSVDVGYLYLQKRHLQTTADAAALAAAWGLPWDNDEITKAALEYAKYNNIDNDHADTIIEVSDAYDDTKAVRVEITKNYPLFFALAPPIGQTDSDVYAMAVATREHTFIDLLPFLLLVYDDVIIDEDFDFEPYDDWENNREDFYNLMTAQIEMFDGLPIELLVKSSAGNWGIADMRDFVSGMDTNGNITSKDVQHILMHGLSEPFCEDSSKHRSGRAGVVSAIETSNPGDDGYRISDRLNRDTDFFIVMILPGLAPSFQGSHSSFGLEDFIIGHVRPLSMPPGGGNNRNLVGMLIDVYDDCSKIPDIYKKWRPVLIE